MVVEAVEEELEYTGKDLAFLTKEQVAFSAFVRRFRRVSTR